MSPIDTSQLTNKINTITAEAGARDIGVAFHDYEQDSSFHFHGDTPFHAASTIKVPIMIAVFDAIDQGRITLETKVHVRNRFISFADKEAFRVSSGRDANSKVHAARGRKLAVGELAHHMIVTSSNLATNLLLDVVGLEQARATLERLGLTGIDLSRGVEDERAHAIGIDNKVTANGLLKAFRMIEEGNGISNESREKMLDILHQQEFKSGIPAGLPSNARVAHKTGEISTVAHDAGLVFPEGRKPYALVILTEWEAEKGERHSTVAKISRLIYRELAGKPEVEHA